MQMIPHMLARGWRILVQIVDNSVAVQFVWFLGNWAAIVLGVLTSQSVGLLIGAAMPKFETAQTTATIVILSFMLASGFWIQQIPSFLFWLKCAAAQFSACSCCEPAVNQQLRLAARSACMHQRVHTHHSGTGTCLLCIGLTHCWQRSSFLVGRLLTAT